MSPIQSSTQEGLITLESATDLSASVGCFAMVTSAGKAALPSSHGLALYVIEDGYDALGLHKTVLRPLNPNRNVRVVSAAIIAAAANVTTDAAGKAVTASSGNNILAIAEEAGVVGQYILLRPLGGIQTA